METKCKTRQKRKGELKMTEILQNIEISNTACISAVIPACNNYHFDDEFYI